MKKFLFILFVLSLFFPSTLSAEGKIDINTAALKQLDELTGIGPKYAQAIIDGRPYSSVDDLLRVKGIGPKTLQKIKDQGLACVDCAAAQSTQNNDQNLNEQKPTNKPTNEPNDRTQVEIPAAVIESQAPIVYPEGIVFNELLPSPQGADETEEWFEIFNSNNFDVDLAGWQIKDSAGTIITFTVPKDTKILTNGYLVFKRPETKIMLNNDEDGLSLLTPDGKIGDSVSFSKAPIGQSYNKTASGWQWSTTSTLGAKNVISRPAAPAKIKKPANSSSSSYKKDNPVIDLSEDSAAASVSGSNKSPWLLFFAAVFALVSGAAILSIKNILSKQK